MNEKLVFISVAVDWDPDSRCWSMGPSGDSNGGQQYAVRHGNPRNFTKVENFTEYMLLFLLQLVGILIVVVGIWVRLGTTMVDNATLNDMETLGT